MSTSMRYCCKKIHHHHTSPKTVYSPYRLEPTHIVISCASRHLAKWLRRSTRFFIIFWANVASWCSCATNNFSLSERFSCVAISISLPHAPNRLQKFFIPHQRYLILCMLFLPHLGSHTSNMKFDLLQRVVHSSFRPIEWHGRIVMVALKLDSHEEFQRSHSFVPQRTAKHSNDVYRGSK